MLRQYNPQRFRSRSVLLGNRHLELREGTIKAGTIVYLQDGVGPFGRDRFAPVICRNPWIVEAWHNRDCLGRTLAGGHLATVRSLRDGRRVQVADWLLLWHDDAGLTA